MNALCADETRIFAERLKLFAQPQRLCILSTLLRGPMAVNQIENETGIRQPTLSQQLGTLRRADIIVARRSSHAVVYQFATDAQAARFRTLIDLLQNGASAPAPAGPIARPEPVASVLGESGAQFARITKPRPQEP